MARDRDKIRAYLQEEWSPQRVREGQVAREAILLFVSAGGLVRLGRSFGPAVSVTIAIIVVVVGGLWLVRALTRAPAPPVAAVTVTEADVDRAIAAGKACPRCGAVVLAWETKCPACGRDEDADIWRSPAIWSTLVVAAAIMAALWFLSGR
jgi:ribosomal protein S27AE